MRAFSECIDCVGTSPAGDPCILFVALMNTRRGITVLGANAPGTEVLAVLAKATSNRKFDGGGDPLVDANPTDRFAIFALGVKGN